MIWIRRLAFFVASALVFVAVTGAAPARPRSAAAPAPITFGTPTLVDPVHTFGEPTIGVDSVGRIYGSGPTGTGTQRSLWFASYDGAHSFRPVNQSNPLGYPSAVTGTLAPPGGGDTEQAFDREGRVYFSDLWALSCFRVARTDDGGMHDHENTLGCGEGGAPADRQWMRVFDPTPGTTRSPYTGPTPLVYMDYNNVSNGSQWVKSTDGLNYTNAIAGNQPYIGGKNYAPFGADGYPAIDQVTGDVFQADGDGTNVLLNIGTPDASGNLTFLDQGGDLTKLIHVVDGVNHGVDVLFPVLSMDLARNLFLVYAIDSSVPAERQIFVTASSPTTGWTRWTAPVQVSHAPAARTNIMPWIQAGAAGIADAVWYGTDSPADPSTDAGQKWDVFLDQVRFPVDSSGHLTYGAPADSQVKATPHPMHYGSICLAGTGCIVSQGNRNTADFFQVKVDRNGAALIIFDDTSNGLIQPALSPNGAQYSDHAGAPLVTVLRQTGGTSLYGTALKGTSNSPVSGMNSAADDARYPVIGGQNRPQFDLLGTSLALADGQLTVTVKVQDLQDPGGIHWIPGANYAQYVTRWQLGNTIWYAGMQADTNGARTFYAGRAGSIDLCSVSACFPHVITFPESGSGTVDATGSTYCPDLPDTSNPCILTITMNAADLGIDSGSLLEEVGTYAFAAAIPQSQENNATALADMAPLEIDGTCCFNFQGAAVAQKPR